MKAITHAKEMRKISKKTLDRSLDQIMEGIMLSASTGDRSTIERLTLDQIEILTASGYIIEDRMPRDEKWPHRISW